MRRMPWKLALWLPEDYMHGDDLHVRYITEGLPQHCAVDNIATCQLDSASPGRASCVTVAAELSHQCYQAGVQNASGLVSTGKGDSQLAHLDT